MRTAALWYCNVGWGRGEIADAVGRRRCAPLPAYSTFGDLTNRPGRGPGGSRRLAGAGPRLEGLPHQRRLRLDRHRHEDGSALLAAPGEPERTVLIRREKAYHGMHTAGTSLAGIPANAAGHGT